MAEEELVGLDVVDDQRVGEGGFLRLRRLRLRVVRTDGSRSAEGLYDFVERPMGLDAVVVALWHRDPGGPVRVLLREGLRVPLAFGRDPSEVKVSGLRPATRLFELVAGILEEGEQGPAAIARRAADEAWEEAGLRVEPSRIEVLGAPTHPTPGMCAELFHLVACQVDDPGAAVRPPGDGSPFEEGARLSWMELDRAIEACVRGEIPDLKTEVALRRLRERLGP